MVIDSSAIVAAITGEPDSEIFRNALRQPGPLSMSSVAVLETRIVLTARLGPAGAALFDMLLANAAIEIVPFDAPLADLAYAAVRRFGKGQGHPAQLNIIDCAVYALARSRGEPLLFKGADFAQTDVIAALA